MDKHLSPDVAPTHRAKYLWLVLGIILSLFATNGRWDLPLAAWLYPLFYLRFIRSSHPLLGFGAIWLASVGTLFFFFYQSDMPVQSPLMIAGCLVISTTLVFPYLFDRLLSPRLGVVSGLLATLIFPLSRVSCEFLNTILVSPFGSIFSLGYTQYGNLPLLQLLSITGVYGISFLMAWFASIGAWIWEQNFAWPRIRPTVLLYSIVMTLVLLSGSIRLTFFPPATSAIRVAGISVAPATHNAMSQARSNFKMNEQITPADITQLRSAFAIVIDELLTRSQREARAGAKIVVWPEAGALTLEEDESALIERGKALARQENVYLEMGYVVLRELQAYRNRTVLIDSQGNVAWTYDKAHPVPGMESFAPGIAQVPTVDTPYGRLANVICFDADFPDLMRQGGSQGVDLMLVPSNDWRGIDPWHTYNATFRAIENGYSLVRQTSRGLSMTVDYQGRVLAATDYYTTEEQTMIAYVPTNGVQTIYALVGDLFAWLCLASLLILGGLTLFPLKKYLFVRLSIAETSVVHTTEEQKIEAGMK